MDRLTILGLNSADLPASFVVVGDPNRVDVVGAHLENVVELSHKREYRTIVGTYRGKAVGVSSHGVGSAGAGVCFTELCRSGAVSRIVRAGTAGGMQPEIGSGDVVVATGAVRDDGLSERLVPPGFPAVASVDVVNALRDATPEGLSVTEGVVLTSDVFYPSEVLGSELGDWAKANVVAVEMEVATLFVVGSLHSVEVGAVLAIDGNPLATDGGTMETYDPNTASVATAVETAVVMALAAAIAVHQD